MVRNKPIKNPDLLGRGFKIISRFYVLLGDVL